MKGLQSIQGWGGGANAIAKHFEQEHPQFVTQAKWQKKKQRTDHVLNFTIIDKESDTVPPPPDTTCVEQFQRPLSLLREADFKRT